MCKLSQQGVDIGAVRDQVEVIQEGTFPNEAGVRPAVLDPTFVDSSPQRQLAGADAPKIDGVVASVPPFAAPRHRGRKQASLLGRAGGKAWQTQGLCRP